MSTSNKMIGHFDKKPLTESFYQIIDRYVSSLVGIQKELKAQLSYSVNRKFLWLWSYEKTADGTLFMSILLDEEVKNPHIHEINHVSKNRWNHSIVIKDKGLVESEWFKKLLDKGYVFASK